MKESKLKQKNLLAMPIQNLSETAKIENQQNIFFYTFCSHSIRGHIVIFPAQTSVPYKSYGCADQRNAK